ncbi:hypothetical protein [Rhizobium sp. LjRoot254]|uniref:hypothetical protein n=1 Tax=Rhizobium sp. LjRoot254 TaxID=3342297 RepID=UPI003ECC858F
MNTLARICWISSPVYLLVGMVFGVWMSATQDHTLAPAHAHLNLIGGVLMAIFGGFYTLFPGAAQTMLAKIQVAATHVAVWFMFPGIIMALTGRSDILAKIGSILGIIAIALFLIQAVRASSASRSA